MKVNLWALISIDNDSRILYTAYCKEMCESAKHTFPNLKNLYIVELKGEVNV